ncbi:MAG: hypothetical protein ABW321_35655 [Polyangiales bacterium]
MSRQSIKHANLSEPNAEVSSTSRTLRTQFFAAPSGPYVGR